MLGIIWGTKMTLGVGVHLTASPSYLPPLPLTLGSDLSPNYTRENQGYGSFVGHRFLGDPRVVGFWFIHGFDPITICIKMGYYHLASLHMVPEILEPQNLSLLGEMGCTREAIGPPKPSHGRWLGMGSPLIREGDCSKGECWGKA